MPGQLTDDEITHIRRNFKRCSEETIDSIVRFRQSRDLACVRPIVRGIVQRYLPASSAEMLKNATDETPLADLRIESLTLLEIVLYVQDALDITIEDSEMREFHTLGDVNRFLEKKIASA